MSLAESLRALKKADLHIHLEGSVGPRTLQKLAAKNKIDLLASTTLPGFPPIPAPQQNNLEGPFSGDFFEFIKLYVKISSSIQSAEDLQLIAEDYAEQAATENITHSEVYVSPSTLLRLGLKQESLCQGLLLAQSSAEKRFGIRLRWIFDIVRNSPVPGEDTLRSALELRERGVDVLAIGLGGLEAGHPAAAFARVFHSAREEGFKIYIHAGETAGAESVWEALNLIQPDRIGHGIRALEDPALVEELKLRGTVLEVCPWSNIQLHLSSETTHPIARMYELGLPMVIASDDPGIFGKSLTENFEFAHACGLTLEQLAGLAVRSIELAGS